MLKNLNIWFFISIIISSFVLIPILTVFSSFFDDTSEYYELLKNTFLLEYIVNSSVLLLSVLVLTFLLGTGSAYLVSFYEFPLSNFLNGHLSYPLPFHLIFMLTL